MNIGALQIGPIKNFEKTVLILKTILHNDDNNNNNNNNSGSYYAFRVRLNAFTKMYKMLLI